MINDSPLPTAGPAPRPSQPWLLIGGLAALLTLCLCLCVGLTASVVGYRLWNASQAVPQIREEAPPTRSPSATAQAAVPQTGVDVPLQYPGHVQPGESHEPYNSDPPTSGPHYAQAARAGFYTEAPPDELLVHNLEHGYVIIWYNCSNLTPEACEQLQADIEAAMQKAGDSPVTHTPKLIAVPRPAMDAQLALTTWGRLDKFDAFDEERILNFIHAFRDKAPEPNVP